jgi:cardiolipin synthase (CMP-forming)
MAADEGMGAGQGGRILTIPNGLSVLRLLGVPVFLWLVLGPHLDAWAVALMIGSAATDWLDGKIARALNQQSRLGEALDPAADRLYIAATLAALAIRAIIPWWLVGLLAVRELMVAGALGLLKRRLGFGTLQVSFVGKAATLCLLYAFPLLLLGTYAGNLGESTRIIGWAFASWGTALYWWAAALYLVQARMLLTGRLSVPAGPGPAEQAPDDGTPASPAHPALSGAGGSASSGTADGTGTNEADGVRVPRRERRKH